MTWEVTSPALRHELHPGWSINMMMQLLICITPQTATAMPELIATGPYDYDRLSAALNDPRGCLAAREPLSR
jgi:hypothetical protein